MSTFMKIQLVVCVFLLSCLRVYGIDLDFHPIPSALKASAEAGDSESLYKLGCIYMDAAFDNVDEYCHLVIEPDDLALAMYYLMKAAKKGHAKANADLGSYYNGTTDLIYEDKKKSLYYYQRAVMLGYNNAMPNLAFIYYHDGQIEKSLNLCKQILSTNSIDVYGILDTLQILSYIYSDTEYADISKLYACYIIMSNITPFGNYEASLAEEIYLQMNNTEKLYAKKIIQHWMNSINCNRTK